MLSRMFRVDDGPKTTGYKGFEQLQNCNKQIEGNTYIAVVQNEDIVDCWVLDDCYAAVDELRRYYAEQWEHLRQPVSVSVAQICRYIP